MEIKYGKIKRSMQFSNIFGTAIQLTIRLKPLIEGQYKLYKSCPDSDTIPSVIDAYEQLKNKQEYLNIDSFIHSMAKELDFSNYDINFKDFFASVLCSIDFSMNTQYCVIWAKLSNKSKIIDDESYIFDILLKNDKKLSEIIQNQYELSKEYSPRTNFLFFYPTNNDKNIKITIDDRIVLNYFCTYILSIIVVKRIGNEYLNHFVLYVCVNEWIRIEDEEIKSIKKEDILKEITNQTEYRIELFGYSKDPKKDIIPVDVSEPNIFKYCNMDDICPLSKKEPPKINNLNLYKSTNQISSPKSNNLELNKSSNQIIEQHEKKLFNKQQEYNINYFEFDHSDFTFRFIKDKKFYSEKQRNQFLEELKEDSIRKKNELYYESGKYYDRVQAFDKNDTEITIFSVLKSKMNLLESRPILIKFREYYNNEDNNDIIDEEELETYENFFYPKTTIKQIFDYCYRNLPQNPTELFLKYKRKSTNGKTITYDKQLTQSSVSSIESIITPSQPTIIYYAKRKSSQKNDASNIQAQTAPILKVPEQETKKPATSITINKTQDNNNNKVIVIYKFLRSCIYDNKNDIPLKKITVKNKTEFTFLNDLYPKLIKATNLDIIAYVVEYKNNYMVKYLDAKTPIEKLPSTFNIQIRPNRAIDYRICVLRKEHNFRYSEDSKNNSFSFAIKFSEKYNNYISLLNLITSYLYHGRAEKELLNRPEYIPSLYICDKQRFRKLENTAIVLKEELIPIFVIWESTKIYESVIKFIQNYLKEDAI